MSPFSHVMSFFFLTHRSCQWKVRNVYSAGWAPRCPASAGLDTHNTHTHTHEQQRTGQIQHRNESARTTADRPEQLYAAQRRTMPCAEGELCHQPDRTPQAPHGHVCNGGCGGRLHGNCGSMFKDHETKRICSTCVAKAGKRKATPAEGAGAGPSKRPKNK